MTTPTGVDWTSWLRRWDAQQGGYPIDRERRFEMMLDALGELLPADFVALDLACGPGSVSERLLARFPRARSIALDYDPVLLTIGRGALGDVDGRLRWVEADLRAADWADRLGVERVDAVLSTTALHWLDAPELVALYRRLGALVRPGGAFLNGDHMRFAPPMAAFRRVVDALKERRRQSTPRSGEDWGAWWAAVGAEPALAEQSAERARRFPEGHHGQAAPAFDVHAAALRDAGFAEVGVLWQNLDNRVLMAVR